MERRAETRGDQDPVALVEWLVGTPEDPLTRGESIDDLLAQPGALADAADQAHPPLPAPADTLPPHFRNAPLPTAPSPPPPLPPRSPSRRRRRSATRPRASAPPGPTTRSLFRCGSLGDCRPPPAWRIPPPRGCPANPSDRPFDLLTALLVLVDNLDLPALR